MSIKDTGCGMSESEIEAVMNNAVSLKQEGNGLGLTHARRFVKNHGGTLSIKSKKQAGTEVVIKLPRAKAPPWFLSQISIFHRDCVVVLDDDASTHQMWRRRLEQFAAHGLVVFHASTPTELRERLKTAPRTALCLLDYELLGHQANGLGLAQELDIYKRSVLVTSRFDEKQTQEGCLKLGMRMLPKAAVPHVSINIFPERVCFATFPNCADVVLIDDDRLVANAWKRAAKRAKVKFVHYYDISSFQTGVSESISNASKIYIDSSIGEARRGEIVAHFLEAQGFPDIRVTTGYSNVSTDLPKGVQVVGKNAPF